jgi:hypothetical protein
LQQATKRQIKPQQGCFPAVLTAWTLHFAIYLESAAFMFHMTNTTPDSSGHCEPRVLSPSNGFWLAPSANQNRRPKHAGVSDTLARSWRTPPGACLLQWKEPSF